MLLCTGLITTSSSMLRSSASTALLGLSRDSWERDSFSLGIRWDLGKGQWMHQVGTARVRVKLVPLPSATQPPHPLSRDRGYHPVHSLFYFKTHWGAGRVTTRNWLHTSSLQALWAFLTSPLPFALAPSKEKHSSVPSICPGHCEQIVHHTLRPAAREGALWALLPPTSQRGQSQCGRQAAVCTDR